MYNIITEIYIYIPEPPRRVCRIMAFRDILKGFGLWAIILPTFGVRVEGLGFRFYAFDLSIRGSGCAHVLCRGPINPIINEYALHDTKVF